ncbi:YciI family protein [Falsihalocynthiibacter sp. SS001]|uniref:YciI family protein n=1 Tax=Falsihalocynthiibacter sp. SS001 TaxID=3349698 RepID=UPI0036D3AFF7
MVAWNEYKKVAKERGALALELYVVESTPEKPPEEVKSNLPAHLDYQRDLEERGVLVLAGPLSDATGNEMMGAGMIIYRAASMDEARALTENDPMHQSGARSFKLRKWLINEGNLTINVGLSTGKTSLT